MDARVDLRNALTSASPQEVLVADADAVLKDACAALMTGRPSDVLRAIDARTAKAFMSERAFHEIGWMSAKSARWHQVGNRELRQLITSDYLPRISVLATPAPADQAWMPDVSDVNDPDDVVHVQVARLISAVAVYSHDRHIRVPGYAPRTRTDYDYRVVQLSIVTDRAESEYHVAVAVNVAGNGTAEIVRWTSGRLNVRPALAWFGLAVALAGAAYLVLSPPDRRSRIAATLEPMLERFAASVERADLARQELLNNQLIEDWTAPPLPVRVASYLARNPDRNMSELHDELSLHAVERRAMSQLLRCHPAFELSSRYGWSVGRVRERLETVPRGQVLDV